MHGVLPSEMRALPPFFWAKNRSISHKNDEKYPKALWPGTRVTTLCMFNDAFQPFTGMGIRYYRTRHTSRIASVC